LPVSALQKPSCGTSLPASSTPREALLSLDVESAPGTELAKPALRPKGSYWYR